MLRVPQKWNNNMFKDKTWVEKSFQTSVNKAHDLNSENKIRNFVLTGGLDCI